MKHKFILALCFMIVLVSLANASYLPHQQDTDLYYSFTSNNATQCNVTTGNTPTGTVDINQLATKVGNTFNISINSSNFSNSGTYCFNLICTDGVTTETGSVCRDVTPSGSILDMGGAITLFGSLFVMIILAVGLFLLATYYQNSMIKITFYTFASIIFIMVVLYAVVIIQQVLFGFDAILNAVETFWFVLAVASWLGFVALMIVVFLIMLKAWKIKRGYYDE